MRLYNPENRHERKPTRSEKKPEGRWRAYTYDEIIARDKASLDIFWLRDESIEDSANLPEPHVLAEEIADDLRASLKQIEDVLADLQARAVRLEKPAVSVQTVNPIQDFHAAIGRRLVGFPSIAKAPVVTSMNVRGRETENQGWKKL